MSKYDDFLVAHSIGFVILLLAHSLNLQLRRGGSAGDLPRFTLACDLTHGALLGNLRGFALHGQEEEEEEEGESKTPLNC